MTGPPTDPDPLPTLRAVFAHADDPVVVTAAHGPSILFANAAAALLVGEPAADLVGRDCLTLLDGITDPTTLERVREGLASDTHLHAEVWARRADGPPRPSRWELIPFRTADGVMTHRVIIAHDLTAQRLAEQSLADLKGTARRAGHDLNNMITGLVLNLSLMNGSAFSETQRQACLNDALAAARDGSRVTRQLLDASGGPHDLSRHAAAAPRTMRPSASPGVRAADRAPADRTTGDVGAASAPKERPRAELLLLDDDEKLLRMMAGFLEHAGYEVRATSEPRECVALYREALAEQRRFDLVILDLTIGKGREGLSTLAALQAIDPGVRAVAHSGHAYEDVMTAPRAHGFVAAIQKPTPLSELTALIDALLRAAR